jgi:hypothetical protein
MKIDNKVLKKLYDIYLEGKSSPTRINCPEPEILIESLRSNLSKKQRGQLIAHLSTCIHCSREFEFLLDTVRIEKEIAEKTRNIISARNKSKKTDPWLTSRFLSHHAWRYISALVMLLFIIVVALVVLKIPQKIEYRRARSNPIRIIYPNEVHLDISKLKFKWKKVSEANFYILEIFDDTLLSIWQSCKLSENHFQPPQSLLQKLIKGKTYFWMVTVYTEAGLRTESSLVDFYVKK